MSDVKFDAIIVGGEFASFVGLFAWWAIKNLRQARRDREMARVEMHMAALDRERLMRELMAPHPGPQFVQEAPVDRERYDVGAGEFMAWAGQADENPFTFVSAPDPSQPSLREAWRD